MSDQQYQVVIFVIGEQGSGKTWVADRMVSSFGVESRYSIAEVVRTIACDTNIFGIPHNYFSRELKDKPLDFPIQVKEAHVRRIISWLRERVPPVIDINFDKFAVSNVSTPRLKTPREVLQYIGFGVINKIPPAKKAQDLVPTLAYNPIVGVPGIFVYDDLRQQSQYDLALTKFQFVYAIQIAPTETVKKKLSKKMDPIIVGPYANEENGWKSVPVFATIKNYKDTDKTDLAIKDALDIIDADVKAKIAKKVVKVMPPTIAQSLETYLTNKGPLSINQAGPKTQGMQAGKAVFAKGNPMVEIPTEANRIKMYHDAGSIDRSSLLKKK